MMKKILKEYPLSCFLTLIIWIVCLIPIPETPLDDFSMIDKWTHFVMYGSLTLVIWMERYRLLHFDQTKMLAPGLICGGVLMPMAMGGLIELAQAYLTTCRSGDWLDFVCNVLGVVVGISISCMIIGIVTMIKEKVWQNHHSEVNLG